MPFEIPDTEPLALRAGDTWEWTRDLADFPHTDGWALAYLLVGVFTLTITATPGTAPGQYNLAVPAATTAPLKGGTIQWAARVTKGTESHTVATGVINVFANPASAAASQTHNEQMYNQLGDLLLARIGTDIAAYTINQRQAHREQIDQLERMFAKYARALWQERHPGQAFPNAKVVFESARWDLPGAWASVEARWPFLVGTL